MQERNFQPKLWQAGAKLKKPAGRKSQTKVKPLRMKQTHGHGDGGHFESEQVRATTCEEEENHVPYLSLNPPHPPPGGGSWQGEENHGGGMGPEVRKDLVGSLMGR